MADLREEIIRLATENPSLRAHLVPLLRKHAQIEDDHGVEVGDIFVSSWGYDQTNISYYQVLKVSRKMVAIREIDSKVVRQSGTSEYVVPVPNKFRSRSSVMRKKVLRDHRGRPMLNIASYARAYPWEGSPNSQTVGWAGH